jgi:hypothetical protein
VGAGPAAQGNQAADFPAYARETFLGAANRMRGPDFAEHLEALRKG